jgi:FlaA1/EpsC-like NDP-sugar epimerase
MIGSFSQAEEELLLARPIRRPLGWSARERFAGASVAVTGAGGSIGSELARQLAACRPARLTLIEQSEHGLFQIERELQDRAPHVQIDPVLADVTRAGAMRRIFRLCRPQVVFHAAAYKHVTMAERAVCAAAAVNVLGTAAVLAAAREVGARFTLVSSDKAAAPRSVMGATKRLAELITIAASPAARTSVVRFGNVLGSSGSVLPLMAERIVQGRSIAVTDPDATRYFMSVGEAVSLVMRADALAQGGETFWFEMGDPIRIADLVERLLRVAAARGLAPVPIEVIGLRPGEKRTEELTMQGADVARSADPDIWVAHEAAPEPAVVAAALRAVVRAVARGDSLKTLEALATAVPEFAPSGQAWACARAERFYVRRDRRRAAKIA